MILLKEFFKVLKDLRYNPLIEVPCTYLAPIISYGFDDPEIEVINPVNESIAVGIAAGAYLSGKKPLVAIQNSGFLNTLNPLTSLHFLYKIPLVFLISWRGHPEVKDAPEHFIVGKNMTNYLNTFNIPFVELNEKNWIKALKKADSYITNKNLPFALLVRKGIFEDYTSTSKKGEKNYSMSRYEAIKIIKNELKDKVLFISTTGYISRESYDVFPTSDFYMMGSMGMAFPIGLGLARYTNKKIVVLDGDGALLMQLGAMAQISKEKTIDLLHVVFDNESYNSTKGQEALSKYISLIEIAKNCGYKHCYFVTKADDLKEKLEIINSIKGPVFIHIKVKKGNKKGIKRISDDYSCEEIKEKFIKEIMK